MYMVLDKNVKDLKVDRNGFYEILTYNKRFFDDTLLELSNGGSACKNYALGATLFFYNIKDSLTVEYLDNGQGLFKFKVYEEISYPEVIQYCDKSFLRLFKFAENIDKVLSSKNSELSIKELFENYTLNDLTAVYHFLTSEFNRRKEIKSINISNYIEFLSKYEYYLLKLLYNSYSGLAIFEMPNILNSNNINKEAFLNLYISLICKENVVCQNYAETGESIFYIKDKKIKEEILLAYLKNFYALLSLNRIEIHKENVDYVIDSIEAKFNIFKEDAYQDKSEDNISCIEQLITNIKNFLN